MSKGVFFALVMLAGVGFISGCQNKAAQEQTLETSLPAEMATPVAELVPEQIQPAQITLAEPAAAPAIALETEKAITREFVPPSEQEIQHALKNAGLYEGEIDGKIGPKTKKAIEEFQAENNLAVDGKVGRKTWEKMKEYLNMSPVAPQEVGN